MKRTPLVLSAALVLFLLGGGAIFWRLLQEPDPGAQSGSTFGVVEGASERANDGDSGRAGSTPGTAVGAMKSSGSESAAESAHGASHGEAEDPARDGTGPFVIEGQVTTVDGVRVRGVDVELYPYERTLFAHQAIQMLAQIAESPPPLVAAPTDARGAFRLEAPGPGRYLVKARAPGFDQAVEGPIDLTLGEPSVFLVIPLPVGYQIDGFVVDHDGEPIPGVPLRLMKKGRGGDLAHFSEHTVSREDGRFLFDGLEATDYVLMVPPITRDSKAAAGTLFPSVTAPTSDLEVRIRDGRPYRGVVVDASGRPIEGAEVTALNPVSFDQVQTDPQGRFELVLEGPDADLVIQHPGHLLHEQRITLGSAREQRFQLDRGLTWAGRIAFPDGTPAAHIGVGALQASEFLGSLQTTTTDADGRFGFTGLADDSGYLLPKLDGYWLPLDQARFRVSDGDAVYALEPTQSFEGVVRGANGAPLAHAWVDLTPSAPTDLRGRAVHWLRGSREGWTDRSGVFRIVDVLPGAPYQLEVAHADAADHLRHYEALPRTPVEIDLAAGVDIELVLVAANGRPAQPATVIVAWPGGRAVTQRPDGVWTGGTRYAPDSSGLLRIENAPPGRATFYVIFEGHVPEQFERESKPGTAWSRTVSLSPAGSLEVSIADESGEPHGMVSVTVNSEEESYSCRRRTGGDGICVFAGLPPGRYQVTASPRVGRPETRSIEVRADYQRVEFEW